MSVSIHDYLVNNNNRLTALLSNMGLENVFTPSTLIDVIIRQDEWWCDIYVDYTISCNDIGILSCAFAGYWWGISPNYTNRDYKLSICLKNIDL